MKLMLNPQVKIRYINGVLSYINLISDEKLSSCIYELDQEIMNIIFNQIENIPKGRISERISYLFEKEVLIKERKVIEYSVQEYKVLLFDIERMMSYITAISRNFKDKGLLIEMGSGLGIFSLSAAKLGMEVICIEPGSSIHISQKIAHDNNLKIHFYQGTIQDFIKYPPLYWNNRKADIVVSEFIGDYILEEGLEEYSKLAKEFLLKDGGKLIPESLSIEVVGVKSTYIQKMKKKQKIRIENIGGLLGLNLSSVNHFFDNYAKGKFLYEDNLYRIDPRKLDLTEVTEYQTIYTKDLLNTFKNNKYGTKILNVVETGSIDGYIFSFRACMSDDIYLTSRMDNQGINTWSTIFIPSNLNNHVRRGNKIKLDWAYVLDFAFWSGGIEGFTINEELLS